MYANNFPQSFQKNAILNKVTVFFIKLYIYHNSIWATMVILDKYNAMFRHKLSLINMIGNKGGGAFLCRNCNIYNVDNVSEKRGAVM